MNLKGLDLWEWEQEKSYGEVFESDNDNNEDV